MSNSLCDIFIQGSWGKRSVVDPAADLPNDLPIDLPANMAGDIPSDLATDLQKRAGWSSMQVNITIAY